MYVWVGRGKGRGMGRGRTYDATWADVSGAGCSGSRFDLSVAQIMQAKQICYDGRASTFIYSDKHVNVSFFFICDLRAVMLFLYTYDAVFTHCIVKSLTFLPLYQDGSDLSDLNRHLNFYPSIFREQSKQRK